VGGVVGGGGVVVGVVGGVGPVVMGTDVPIKTAHVFHFQTHYAGYVQGLFQDVTQRLAMFRNIFGVFFQLSGGLVVRIHNHVYSLGGLDGNNFLGGSRHDRRGGHILRHDFCRCGGEFSVYA